MARPIKALPAAVAGLCLLPAVAVAAGDVNVAALQVALHARGLYSGPVDGYMGAGTRAGVIRLERRARLPVDGIAGPQVRRRLGRLGRPPLGERTMHVGQTGWDVAALQFRLAWRGFPSGYFDGAFGAHVQAAVEGFQRFAGLPPDGVAGPATLAALRRLPIPVSPIRLSRPVTAAVGDRFGPRDDRFHSGVDFLASSGAAVRAAGAGRVVFAGYSVGGYGRLIVVRHTLGVTSWYAHLSRISVHKGEGVRTGELLGRVGATGDATGPHLHFEVHVRGAAVDPLTALR